MRALIAAAEAAAAIRVGKVLDRMAAQAADVPGVHAEREGEAVVLRGRGLARRMLSDRRLRELGERT